LRPTFIHAGADLATRDQRPTSVRLARLVEPLIPNPEPVNTCDLEPFRDVDVVVWFVTFMARKLGFLLITRTGKEPVGQNPIAPERSTGSVACVAGTDPL